MQLIFLVNIYLQILFRLMLLDPRYSHIEMLEVLDNFTADNLPTALAQHMENVITSVSRLECYVTGNVDRDGVSFFANTYIIIPS